MKKGDIVFVHNGIAIINQILDNEIYFEETKKYSDCFVKSEEVRLATLEEKIDFLVRKSFLNDTY